MEELIDKNFDGLEDEMKDVMELLSNLDATTEDYAKVAKNYELLANVHVKRIEAENELNKASMEYYTNERKCDIEAEELIQKTKSDHMEVASRLTQFVVLGGAAVLIELIGLKAEETKVLVSKAPQIASRILKVKVW